MAKKGKSGGGKVSSYGDPITLENVRLNYVHLAQADTEGKFPTGKFSVEALIPKTDKKQLKMLFNTFTEVAEVDSIDDVEKHPFLDDDGNIRDGDEKENEGYAGHFFFKTYSGERPDCYVLTEDGEVEDVSKDTDRIKSEFYAGAYYDLVLLPALLENGTVTLFLNGVMLVSEGPKFRQQVDTKQAFLARHGGKSSAVKKRTRVADAEEEDEDEEEEEAPKAKKGKAPAKDDGTTATKKRTTRKAAEVEEDENEEEEDEAPKPAKKGAKATSKKPPKQVEEEEDEDEGEEEDDDEVSLKPKKKERARRGKGDIKSFLD